jgi:16S rRNA (guanine966-N2)-methyltransferase
MYWHHARVRVVAGEFRGRRLHAPAGSSTRPTADRVREALFSILGPLDGLRVLDLFAGSGALGIEALSRGAREAVFVDSDSRAIAAIRRNLEAVGSDAPVHRRDALAYLRNASGGPYDLVFLDPPYSSASELAGPLTERLPAVLTQDARIVFESDKRNPLELSLPLLDERVYGDTRIAIHRAA